jgi:hypothetical protein
MVPAKWKPPVAAASAAPRRAASRRLPPGEASCGGSGGTLGSKRRAPHRGRQLPARGERGGSCSISGLTGPFATSSSPHAWLYWAPTAGGKTSTYCTASVWYWRRCSRILPRLRRCLQRQQRWATPQLCAGAVLGFVERVSPLSSAKPRPRCRLTAWPRGASATCTTTWPLAPPMRHQLRPMMTRPSRQLLQQP